MRVKFVFILFVLLSGCATSMDTYNPDPFCTGNSCYIELEKHTSSKGGDRNSKIGFIEFNDLGFQRDREAVRNILININELNNNSPLLIVVFIHGWHHNANPDDSNVKSFKNFLINLQYEEDNISFSSNKRQVVGVYIGWRGESNESVFTPLTYRSRKNAGLRVGQYGVQEILAELNQIRLININNRLVSIGHSFGGGVLYSSVIQNLVDSVVSVKPDSNTGKLPLIDKAYGDLVILMNPALEAARVEVLNRRLSESKSFDSCQPLALASFTSEYDEALSKAFPKGQTVFFGNDIEAVDDEDYKTLVKTSLGNQDSFRTHELICDNCVYSKAPVFLSIDQYRNAFSGWSKFRKEENAQFEVDDMVLSHYIGTNIKPGSPIINVYVKGDNIIADHNAIWGGEFAKFARALIGMEFAKQNQCNKK